MPVLIGPEQEEYLKTREAAERADCVPATIVLWCRQNRITCIQGGSKRWLVNRKSLEEWLTGKVHVQQPNQQ